MRIQMARMTEKRCPMSTPACFDKVVGLIATFSGFENSASAVEASGGRYVRGTNKGQLRGWASIEVVEVGGWQVLGYGAGNGRVVKPGMILSIVITDYVGNEYFKVAR